MFRKSLILLAAVTAAMPMPAHGGAVPGFRLPPGGVHPVVDSAMTAWSGGMLNQWRFQRDWQSTAQSYGAALRFAQCAARFNPDSLALVQRPIGAVGDREALVRFVRENRACIGEQTQVSPLLIRVALAETAMHATASPHQRSIGAVGVPEVVDGYPLAAVSRCLVQKAPASVAALLKTRPGEQAEGIAAQKLFREVPDCAPRQTVRLTPTAARLALVDAIYHQGAGNR